MRSKSAKKLLQNIPIKPDELWFDQTLEKVQMLSGKQQKSKFNFLQMLFMKNKLRYLMVIVPLLLLLSTLSIGMFTYYNGSKSENLNLSAEEEKNLLQKIWSNNEIVLIKSVEASDFSGADLSSNYIYFTQSQFLAGPRACINSFEDDPLKDLYEKVSNEAYYYESNTKVFDMRIQKYNGETASLNAFLTDYDEAKLTTYEYKGGEYAVKTENDIPEFQKPASDLKEPNSIQDVVNNNFNSTAKIIAKKKNSNKYYYLIQTESRKQDYCLESKDLVNAFDIYWVEVGSLKLYKTETYFEEINPQNLESTYIVNVSKIEASDENIKNTFFLENQGIKIKNIGTEDNFAMPGSNEILQYIKENLNYIFLVEEPFKAINIYSMIPMIKSMSEGNSIDTSYNADRSFYSDSEIGQKLYDSVNNKESDLVQSIYTGASKYDLTIKHNCCDPQLIISVHIPATEEARQSLLEPYGYPKEALANSNYITKQIEIDIEGQILKTDLALISSNDISNPIVGQDGNFTNEQVNPVTELRGVFSYGRYVFIIATAITDTPKSKYEDLFNQIDKISFRKVDVNSDELSTLVN